MSLRQQLKGATAREHKALEARLGLTHPDVSLDDYVRYLYCTYGYYAAVEPVLAASAHLAATGIDTRFRPRLEMLADDLSYLGATTPSVSAQTAYVPGHGVIPELLGCSYVLEGASLGGAILYRHFARKLGVCRGKGATFLYGDGDGTARRWADFVEALDETVLTKSEERACVAAARRTFRGMDAWFGQNGWP